MDPSRMATLRRAAPFAAATLLAFPTAYLPPDVPNAQLMLAAGGMSMLVLAAVALPRWDELPRWVIPVPALLFLGVIAILREAEGGAASGYGPLVVVPLFWVASYGDRRDVVTTSVGIVLVFLLPVLLVGEPQYPGTEWRRLSIWAAIAPIVGLSVNRLVATNDQLARTDPLTSAANRRAWNERVLLETARAERSGRALSLALLDLDHFKRYNDEHRHQAGDELLRAAVSSWRDCLRRTDLLARWGGEEFAVLLPDTQPAEAVQLMERVRRSTPHGQTVSVGLAVWQLGEPFDDTVGRADANLYDAKRSGRDRVIGPGRRVR